MYIEFDFKYQEADEMRLFMYQAKKKGNSQITSRYKAKNASKVY